MHAQNYRFEGLYFRAAQLTHEKRENLTTPLEIYQPYGISPLTKHTYLVSACMVEIIYLTYHPLLAVT